MADEVTDGQGAKARADDGPACGPGEALLLFGAGLALSYAAAHLDANPSTVAGSLQPLLMFLAWIGPAYALAAWRGRDPLVAHGLLVRSHDLRPAALVSVVLLALFALGYVLWARASGLTTGASPPNEVTRTVIYWLLWGFLFVALPEEYFFRGVLQPAFDRARDRAGRAGDRPGTRSLRVFGADLGRGALISALLFGLGHVTLDLAIHGTTAPLRVATFLPGLWFAWLRARTGGVLAPALAHAVANALAFGLIDAYAP